jgi:pimeloyl-ACP methyl ester carboxylesterase
MNHIYCISGLGADEKVFSKFEFRGHEIHFIKWNIPEKNETMNSYAKKLSGQIHHDNPILIGLSFGGIMCIEIARIVPVQMIILISSIKSYREMPYWMRLSGKLKLDKIFPLRSFKLIEPLENYNLGLESREEREMVNAYRRNIDRQYCEWAINKMLNWNNDWKPQNLFHIHGANDRIFPIKKIKADHIIPNAGHFMIMNRAAQVNDQINAILFRSIQSI